MNIGKLAKFIRRYYAPFLLKPMVKIVVMIIFAGLFILSLISMQYIQLGLGMLDDPCNLRKILNAFDRSTTGFA